jgi:hypothetical protein
MQYVEKQNPFDDLHVPSTRDLEQNSDEILCKSELHISPRDFSQTSDRCIDSVESSRVDAEIAKLIGFYTNSKSAVQASNRRAIERKCPENMYKTIADKLPDPVRFCRKIFSPAYLAKKR